MQVETSREAVGERIDELLGWLTGPDSGQNDGITETVRVLRALLSERDAATARAEGAERERDEARAGVDEWYEKAVRYISERDAARAERAAARAFCERVATPCSEPLNSAWLYRDKESRRHFQAELRREARAALGAASAGEAIQGSVGKEAEGWPND